MAKRASVLAETAVVAWLTLLAMTLPLGDASAPGDLGALIVVATVVGTVVGTVVAQRRAAGGGALERLFYRAAVSTVVASVALLVLVAFSAP